MDRPFTCIRAYRSQGPLDKGTPIVYRRFTMNESTPAVTPLPSPNDQRDPALLDTAAFAEICKALGHPARVRIVEHLKAIDSCICGEIVQILPLAQSTVSQHLKLLKAAGLVKGEVEGPRTCYCLDRDMLERFKRTVGSI